MGVTLAAWLAALQALLPPGRAFPRGPTAVFTRVLSSIAAMFLAAQLRLEGLLAEMDPRAALTMLPDWERMLGLPDACAPTAGLSVPDRQRLAYQRLVEQGGQSRAYFLGLAGQLGEPNSWIDEFRPANCNGNCNGTLNSQADVFTWRLNFPHPATNARPGNCSDNCDAAINLSQPSLAECPITERKPAYTTVLFSYEAPSLQLTFDGTVVDPRITFSGGVNGTRVNPTGAIEAAVCPRIDYDPVTLACRGLLMEAASTNMLLSSGDLRQPSEGNAIAAWSQFVDADTVVALIATPSPTGGANTSKLRCATVGAAQRQISQSWGAADNSQWCVSIFATPAEVSALGFTMSRKDGTFPSLVFNVVTRAVLSQAGAGFLASGVQPGPLGSYRFWVAFDVGAGASAAAVNWQLRAVAGGNYSGAVGDGMLLDGAMCEPWNGAGPTSYIATGAATVTRSADSALMTGTNFSDWFNSQQGTLLTEFEADAADTTFRRAASIGDLAALNEIYLGRWTNAALSTVVAAGVGDVDLVGYGALASPMKSAIAYAPGDFARAFSGALATDATGAFPSGMDRLGIGCSPAGASQIQGRIRSLAFYKRRLSNERLQALTA